MENKNYCDIAILTAKYENEFASLNDIILTKEIDNEIDDNASYFYRTELNCKKGGKVNVVIASDDRMGLTSTATLATKILFHYKPKYLCMVGICASTKRIDHNIGDIIIPRNVWDYGSGKQVLIKNTDTATGKEIEIRKFEPQIDPVNIDSSLEKLFLSLKDNRKYLDKIREDWNIKYKEIYLAKNDINVDFNFFASGASVIQDERYVDDIKSRHTKLAGFDMEAYAIYYAVKHSYYEGCKAFVIKSVSDYGDSKKDNPDKESHQKYAAFTSSQYLKHLIENELDF